MTITTITIGAVGYVSYATVVEADGHLAVDATRRTAWEALVTADKERLLVAATNRLDLLNWAGEKTNGDAAQPNQWPRTGVTYPDGTAVSTTEVPVEVERATAVMAGTLALDATQADVGGSGSNTKRVKAGSAEVEFFRQQDGVPLQDETVYALVLPFLDGQDPTLGGSAGNCAKGTDGVSSFSDRDEFGRDRGFP